LKIEEVDVVSVGSKQEKISLESTMKWSNLRFCSTAETWRFLRLGSFV